MIPCAQDSVHNVAPVTLPNTASKSDMNSKFSGLKKKG